MPVLCGETSIYPDDLLEGESDDDPDSSWWVLYTKSRQEKAVARHLWSRQVAFYLPLVKRTLVYGSRRVVSHMPLFAGYVFMHGTWEARLVSLASNRLSRILEVKDGAQLREDLARIRCLIASNAPLTPESRLVPGKRVRVRRGPLEGLEGTMLRRHGRTRIVVAVNFIQQGASVEIDDYLLELVE